MPRKYDYDGSDEWRYIEREVESSLSDFDPRYDRFRRSRSPVVLPAPRVPSPVSREYRGHRRGRHHRYTPPKDYRGNALSLDVRLYGFEDNESPETNFPGLWPWPTTPGPGGSQKQPHHMLSITAARRWFDSSKQHRLDLTCSPSLLEIDMGKEYPIKWLHVERQVPDFDEFETIAMNMPELTGDWKLVASGLFKRLTELAHRKGDDYPGPWMLRADGRKSDWAGKRNVPPSVTSLSFPCFELGPIQGHGKKNTQHQYPLMSLYQWSDCTHAARQWDKEQSYPKMADVENAKGQIIYMPHIWCVIAGNVLLTYGPIAFEALLGDSIKQVSPKAEVRKGPSSVQVTDVLGSTHVFDMKECRTFFELQRTITRKCIQNPYATIDDIDILLSDGSVLTGASWVAAVQTEETTTVNLLLARKKASLAQEHQREPRRRFGDAPHFVPPPRHRSRSRPRLRYTKYEPYRTRERHREDEDYPPRGRGVYVDIPMRRMPEDTFTYTFRPPAALDGDAANQTDATASNDSKKSGSGASSRVILSDSDGSDDSSNSDSDESDISAKPENTCRAVVLYHGDIGRATRPSLKNGGVTEVGYPTSLILSNAGGPENIRINHSVEAHPLRQELFVRRDLERAMDSMRATQGQSRIQREEQADSEEQRPGVLVFKKSSAYLPSMYVPLQESSHPQEPETSRRHRSTRNPIENGNIGPSNSRERASGSENPQPSANQPHRRPAGPSMPKVNVNLKIRIPPFLSWATHTGFDARRTMERSEHIERILESIHITLREQPSESNRKLYRLALELRRDALEETYPFLKRLDTGIRERPSSPENGEPIDAEGGHSTTASFDFGAVDSQDSIHVDLLKKCNKAITEFLQTVEEFFSYYVPTSSNHATVQKCWGAFETILSITKKGLEQEQKKREESEATFWLVRDISNDPLASQHIKPSLPWQECRQCRVGHIYRDYDEAVRHVRNAHFKFSSRTGKDPEIAADTLANWVRSDHQYRVDQRLELFTTYLNLSLGHMCTVLARAKYIREGVINTHAPQTTRYMLPSSLVSSLECVVMLVLFTARSFEIVNRYCNDFMKNQGDKDKETEGLLRLTRVKNELEAAGHVALESMEKAKLDIMLMTFTNVDTGTVSYDAVGPEYIILTVMQNLFTRPLHGKERIDQVYSSFVRKVYLDAKNHPRTRVIRDIWRLREELDLINAVIYAQDVSLDMFWEILCPSRFRVTTQTRDNHFDVEWQFIAHAQDECVETSRKVDAMVSRLRSINTHVVQMLEIQQENNGNALIVFTLVTIIFLPLSWATSYLGMNTSDIRAMRSSQWLFWAIAVPVASVVIGLSLLVVLKGEAIREFLIRKQSGMERRLASRRAPKRTASKSFTMVSTHKTGEEEKGAWNRFRRRKNGGALSNV